MVVTKVRRKGNNIYVIFDDDNQLCVPYDVFLKNYLSVDDVINEQKLVDIELKSELFRIKQSSFRYLSGRNHSRFELRTKLLKKKYDKSLVDSVLDDLEKQYLINDLEFAKEYFNSLLKRKRGLLKIKSDLYNKGVNREIIEQTVEGHEEDSVFIESAISLAKNKYNILQKRNLTDKQISQKIYQYLVSRGFTRNIIMNAINTIRMEQKNV